MGLFAFISGSMKNKKILYWSLGSVAFLGLGYFVYRKIADRNKKFIKDGNFTIIVDETIVADPNQPDTVSESDLDLDTGYTPQDFSEEDVTQTDLDLGYLDYYNS